MTQETKVLVGIGIITIAIVAGAIFFLSGRQVTQNGNQQVADPQILVRQNSNKISSGTSRVTLVEFGDYQCPACGAVHPVVKEMLEENKGKITFVFRHFPLPGHKNAEIAAEAAEAAGEQEKYWEMHNLIYENQAEWSEGSDPLSLFVGYAKTLQLNSDHFRKSVESKKYSQKITQDKNDGLALGVNSTPTFFLNGKRVVLRSGYTELEDKIKASLKNE